MSRNHCSSDGSRSGGARRAHPARAARLARRQRAAAAKALDESAETAPDKRPKKRTSWSISIAQGGNDLSARQEPEYRSRGSRP